MNLSSLSTDPKWICRQAAKDGVLAYDCLEGEEVFLLPYALFFPGDNPMQAELCSHAGLNCNYFCRTCLVGGTKAEKESDGGFLTMFKVRSSRSIVNVV